MNLLRITSFGLLIITAMVTVSGLAKARSETTNAPAEGIGFRQLQVTDPLALGTPLPVVVWYPTAEKSRPITLGPFNMDVALDAPPTPDRHPLIVISHGSGGTNLAHRDFALALARRGYVVAAPEHRVDNYRDTSGVGTAALWAGRPREVSQTITAMLDEPKLGPSIDPARIGAIGMSAGGYTVLALAGAQADINVMIKHCTETNDDQTFCYYRERILRQPGPAIIPEPLPNAQDKRIKAIVALAPVTALFSDDAIRAIAIPVRLYAAEKDDILAPRYHAERLHRLLTPSKLEYTLVKNAGHFSFVAPFPSALSGQVGLADSDPPGFDRPAWHEQAAIEIADYFDRALSK